MRRIESEEKLFCLVTFEFSSKSILKSFRDEIYRFDDLKALIKFLESVRFQRIFSDFEIILEFLLFQGISRIREIILK